MPLSIIMKLSNSALISNQNTTRLPKSPKTTQKPNDWAKRLNRTPPPRLRIQKRPLPRKLTVNHLITRKTQNSLALPQKTDWETGIRSPKSGFSGLACKNPDIARLASEILTPFQDLRLEGGARLKLESAMSESYLKLVELAGKADGKKKSQRQNFDIYATGGGRLCFKEDLGDLDLRDRVFSSPQSGIPQKIKILKREGGKIYDSQSFFRKNKKNLKAEYKRTRKYFSKLKNSPITANPKKAKNFKKIGVSTPKNPQKWKSSSQFFSKSQISKQAQKAKKPQKKNFIALNKKVKKKLFGERPRKVNSFLQQKNKKNKNQIRNLGKHKNLGKNKALKQKFANKQNFLNTMLAKKLERNDPSQKIQNIYSKKFDLKNPLATKSEFFGQTAKFQQIRPKHPSEPNFPKFLQIRKQTQKSGFTKSNFFDSRLHRPNENFSVRDPQDFEMMREGGSLKGSGKKSYLDPEWNFASNHHIEMNRGNLLGERNGGFRGGRDGFRFGAFGDRKSKKLKMKINFGDKRKNVREKSDIGEIWGYKKNKKIKKKKKNFGFGKTKSAVFSKNPKFLDRRESKEIEESQNLRSSRISQFQEKLEQIFGSSERSSQVSNFQGKLEEIFSNESHIEPKNQILLEKKCEKPAQISKNKKTLNQNSTKKKISKKEKNSEESKQKRILSNLQANKKFSFSKGHYKIRFPSFKQPRLAEKDEPYNLNPAEQGNSALNSQFGLNKWKSRTHSSSLNAAVLEFYRNQALQEETVKKNFNNESTGLGGLSSEEEKEVREKGNFGKSGFFGKDGEVYSENSKSFVGKERLKEENKDQRGEKEKKEKESNERLFCEENGLKEERRELQRQNGSKDLSDPSERLIQLRKIIKFEKMQKGDIFESNPNNFENILNPDSKKILKSEDEKIAASSKIKLISEDEKSEIGSADWCFESKKLEERSKMSIDNYGHLFYHEASESMRCFLQNQGVKGMELDQTNNKNNNGEKNLKNYKKNENDINRRRSKSHFESFNRRESLKYNREECQSGFSGNLEQYENEPLPELSPKKLLYSGVKESLRSHSADSQQSSIRKSPSLWQIEADHHSPSKLFQQPKRLQTSQRAVKNSGEVLGRFVLSEYEGQSCDSDHSNKSQISDITNSLTVNCFEEERAKLAVGRKRRMSSLKVRGELKPPVQWVFEKEEYKVESIRDLKESELAYSQSSFFNNQYSPSRAENRKISAESVELEAEIPSGNFAGKIPKLSSYDRKLEKIRKKHEELRKKREEFQKIKEESEIKEIERRKMIQKSWDEIDQKSKEDNQILKKEKANILKLLSKKKRESQEQRKNDSGSQFEPANPKQIEGEEKEPKSDEMSKNLGKSETERDLLGLVSDLTSTPEKFGLQRSNLAGIEFNSDFGEDQFGYSHKILSKSTEYIDLEQIHLKKTDSKKAENEKIIISYSVNQKNKIENDQLVKNKNQNLQPEETSKQNHSQEKIPQNAAHLNEIFEPQGSLMKNLRSMGRNLNVEPLEIDWNEELESQNWLQQNPFKSDSHSRDPICSIERFQDYISEEGESGKFFENESSERGRLDSSDDASKKFEKSGAGSGERNFENDFQKIDRKSDEFWCDQSHIHISDRVILEENSDQYFSESDSKEENSDDKEIMPENRSGINNPMREEIGLEDNFFVKSRRMSFLGGFGGLGCGKFSEKMREKSEEPKEEIYCIYEGSKSEKKVGK